MTPLSRVGMLCVFTFAAAFLLGMIFMRWAIFIVIERQGVFETGSKRIVGKVEEKQWPKE